jgi:hypothetical protein
MQALQKHFQATLDIRNPTAPATKKFLKFPSSIAAIGAQYALLHPVICKLQTLVLGMGPSQRFQQLQSPRKEMDCGHKNEPKGVGFFFYSLSRSSKGCSYD